MYTARRLVEAVESESDQLSADFLQQPALRKRLLKAGCNLVFNLAGANEIVLLAAKDKREKKDYNLKDRVNQFRETWRQELAGGLTPPLTDRESTSMTTTTPTTIAAAATITPTTSTGQSGPDYKSWVDDKGNICYEVHEVEVSFSGTLRDIQYLVLLSDVLPKPLAITKGCSAGICREFLAMTTEDRQYEFIEKSRIGKRIARVVCFDRKLDLTQEDRIDIVTSHADKGVLSVRPRTTVWQGPMPQNAKGVKYDLFLQTITGWSGIAYRSIDGDARVDLMSRGTNMAVNTISIQSDMKLNVYAHLQKAIDTEYRLLGEVKNSKTANSGAVKKPDGQDGGGDNDNGSDPSKKRKKTNDGDASSGKGASKVSKGVGGRQSSSTLKKSTLGTTNQDVSEEDSEAMLEEWFRNQGSTSSA